MAYSPDGKTLASASNGGTVKLWDLARGRARVTLTMPDPVRLNSVAFSPGGRLVAAAGGGPPGIREQAPANAKGRLAVWDADSGGLRRTIDAPAVAVGALAFSDDGTRLAACLADYKARTWDVASGLPVDFVRLPSWPIPSAFSPNLKTVAARGPGSSVVIVEIASGRTVATLAGHSRTVTALAFSADGRTLASGTGAEPWEPGKPPPTDRSPGEVKVWDVSGGSVRERATLARHPQNVNALALSRDGRLIARLEYGTTIHDATDGRLVSVLQGGTRFTRFFALAPESSSLAVAPILPGPIEVWDVETAARRGMMGGGSADRIAFLPDGKTLAVAMDDGRLVLRDVADGRTRTTLTNANSPITSLAVSPGGAHVATGAGNGTVDIWETSTGIAGGAGTPSGRFGARGHESEVTGLAYSPDGKALASGGKEGNIRLQFADSRAATELKAGGPILAIAFAPDGRTLAVACEGVQVWDVAEAKRVSTIPAHTVKVPRRAMTSKVVDGKTARTFEPVPGEFIERKATVTALAFAPDGKTIAVGESFGFETVGSNVAIREAATGREILSFRQEQAIVALALSPDGAILATATSAEVRLSDAATGRERATRKFAPLTDRVRAVAFSPDGKTLAVSVGWAIRLWDVPALLDGAK